MHHGVAQEGSINGCRNGCLRSHNGVETGCVSVQIARSYGAGCGSRVEIAADVWPASYACQRWAPPCAGGYDRGGSCTRRASWYARAARWRCTCCRSSWRTEVLRQTATSTTCCGCTRPCCRRSRASGCRLQLRSLLHAQLKTHVKCSSVAKARSGQDFSPRQLFRCCGGRCSCRADGNACRIPGSSIALASTARRDHCRPAQSLRLLR